MRAQGEAQRIEGRCPLTTMAFTVPAYTMASCDTFPRHMLSLQMQLLTAAMAGHVFSSWQAGGCGGRRQGWGGGRAKRTVEPGPEPQRVGLLHHATHVRERRGVDEWPAGGVVERVVDARPGTPAGRLVNARNATVAVHALSVRACSPGRQRRDKSTASHPQACHASSKPAVA